MTILQIIQLLVSALLILTIILQQRGAGSSIITGGGGASYYSKRGLEKFLFIATIVLSVLFILLGIAVIIIH